ncbi:MAG: 3-deoxy-D-manno-octulosonic acid transferase [Methylococcales bacterium]|jgi:3-deoxy-D-manno-octulosonic-acid transferase|nr:3-deoxy-D-manno-octulosonic acid transferase [Methylococcales bacterium]MBT7410347.1 3-deoxy-D-manno-octulosonic acid transferase [Methylococcales bacterium]
MKRLFYTVILYLLIPFVLLKLLKRGMNNRGYWYRINERFGFYKKIITDKNAYIWLHAVSVGEVNAAVPIVLKLIENQPDYSILITTMTPTGSARVIDQFDDKVEHVYLPYDLPDAIQRFLVKFKPKMAVIMETELWPNLYHYTDKKKIPILISNARISDHSFKGYVKIKGIVSEVLSHVSMIATQSQEDASRLIKLGAVKSKVKVVGNIKFDKPISDSLQTDAIKIKKLLPDNHNVWIAASTHDHEDEKILLAFKRVREKCPDTLLIIVPRHPERFDRVYKLCVADGFNVAKRSDNGVCSAETSVLIGDSMGELMLYYAVSDIAYIGGSLVSHGGQNPLEAAQIKLPVVYGKYMHNFREITSLLESNGGSVSVENESQLAEQVINWLKNKKLRQEAGEKNHQVLMNNKGALDKTVELIKNLG